MSDDTPADPGPTTAVLPRDPGADTPTPGTLPHPLDDHPESAADAPAAATQLQPPTAPRTTGVGLPARVTGPVRASTVVGWMVAAARVCGEWTSLDSSAALRAVTVVVPSHIAFVKWCGHLGIGNARRKRHTDQLGAYSQGVTQAHGWTITVHLPNA